MRTPRREPTLPSRETVDAWTATAPWSTDGHVLQDLLLTRLIVESANDPHLRRRLVLHGGTCLHKIWHDRPQRYSEDLDYLCVKPWHLFRAVSGFRRINRARGSPLGFNEGPIN